MRSAAIDASIRMLLDGLEVDSIRTLKAIVDGARKASQIYEGLRLDENDGEFALWREDDLVNALHELGTLFRMSDAATTPEGCPDCSEPWPDELAACPSCGLTIEDVAERLAEATR